jgi:hypothetical protein
MEGMNMTKLCETLIAKDISFDCDEMSVKGLEADGVIINRNDVDFSKTVFDDDAKNIIKQMVLKSGKKGYEVVQMGNTPFTGTTSTLAVGTYRNTWTHEIPIAVLANDPEVCEKIIDGLANGTFILVLRNKAKGSQGKGEYQIFGFYQGLVASAGTNEKYSDETEGGWLMTLQETNAPKSALFLFDTDSEATQARYNALKTASNE